MVLLNYSKKDHGRITIQAGLRNRSRGLVEIGANNHRVQSYNEEENNELLREELDLLEEIRHTGEVRNHYYQ